MQRKDAEREEEKVLSLTRILTVWLVVCFSMIFAAFLLIMNVVGWLLGSGTDMAYIAPPLEYATIGATVLALVWWTAHQYRAARKYINTWE